MKFRVAPIVLTTLTLICCGVVLTSGQSNAAATVDDLNAQLNDLQYKEADLKIQLEQLESDLKPENIQRHFNGYGSTRPEELREARRRQLQIQKDYVLKQLDLLASNRARLTTSISEAQARAYQQSAQNAAALQPNPERRAFVLSTARTIVALSVLVVVLASLGLRVVIRRRRHF